MADAEAVDAVVIGAGVVGLAVARELALRGRDVLVVEAEPAIGTHTSSRNSEVIHAGIYYPTGSLKAATCVEGKELLYRYCEREGVAHRRVGKLIVAGRDDEVPALERLEAQARANGVTDLTWLTREDIRALEPAVTASRGLFSPSTGIIDSHGFMTALRRDAVERRAHVVLNTPVLGGSVEAERIVLQLGGPEPMTLSCRSVVNSAGFSAPKVASQLRGLPAEAVPKPYYAKGHYFVLEGASPFSHLVYPIPVPGGLGIHVTLDLNGRARFGPDVSYTETAEYGFDESRAESFYKAIRNYFPALRDGALQPGYCGVRPKLGPANAPAADFVVQGPAEHGVRGLVNLFGIESPGLTASLALARRVTDLLDG